MTTIFLCPRCRAIIGSQIRCDERHAFACPTCRARFIPDDTCDYCPRQPAGQRGCLEVEAFLRDWWSSVEIPDPAEQQARLAEAAALVAGNGDGSGTVLTGLFRTLAAARGFVHFTSWGISHLMLGALKLLSEQDVHVSGLVSAAYPNTLDELKKSDKELESLWLNVVGISRDESNQAPHQKLIVIDGLVAFKGSANLTTSGWRKASRQQEMVEVVTDPVDVMRLHNGYFSGPWARWGRNRYHQVGDIIRMGHM